MDERPRPSLARRFWMVPIFAGLIGYELYRANEAGVEPDWKLIAIASAGLLYALVVRGFLLR
jgi:hypothetical protein